MNSGEASPGNSASSVTKIYVTIDKYAPTFYLPLTTEDAEDVLDEELDVLEVHKNG